MANNNFKERIQKRLDRLVNKNNLPVYIILILVGIILILLSIYKFPDSIQATISQSIGISFLTTVLLFFICLLLSPLDSGEKLENLINRYIQMSDDLSWVKNLYTDEGIMNVKKKAEYYGTLNEKFSSMSKEGECDILTYGGLKELRLVQGEVIKNKLKTTKIHIRVLTVNPYAPFLFQSLLDNQQNSEENSTTDIRYEQIYADAERITNDIWDLIKWVEDLKTEKITGQFDLRFYNSLPSLHSHRIDDFLIVSSKEIGKECRQHRTIEYKQNSEGYTHYCKHFKMLWESANFSQAEPGVNLHPYLLIGDSRLGNLLKHSCERLETMMAGNPILQVRAMLALWDVPTSGERLSTNIAWSDGAALLMKVHKEIDNEKQVAGIA